MAFVDPIGHLFLRLERAHQPMHVGGLLLFSLPEDAPPDYVARLIARMRAAGVPRPPFDRVLGRRLGQPTWRQSKAFDVGDHLHHRFLASTGTIRDLLAEVSQLHGDILDRSQPLWEAYLIEGIAERRFALYIKFHHAIMDGVSAMRLLQRCFIDAPEPIFLRVPWALPAQTDTASAASSSNWQTLSAGVRQTAALPSAVRGLYTNWQHARADDDYTGGGLAPRCMLNRPVSGVRRFAAQSYSLARIRSVGRLFNATINDVVLALCGSALRHYLIEQDALPDRPLIALVPMSLHDETSQAGNRLGAIHANLATHLTDPVARLTTTQRSVAYWKRRYRGLSAERVTALTAVMTAPTGLNLLSGVAPRHQGFNLVISNVPGPDKPLYFGDAPLLGMYPMSVVTDGQALNISLISYNDSLEFGLTACAQTVPHVQTLLGHLETALETLEHAGASSVQPPLG